MHAPRTLKPGTTPGRKKKRVRLHVPAIQALQAAHDHRAQLRSTFGIPKTRRAARVPPAPGSPGSGASKSISATHIGVHPHHSGPTEARRMPPVDQRDQSRSVTSRLPLRDKFKAEEKLPKASPPRGSYYTTALPRRTKGVSSCGFAAAQTLYACPVCVSVLGKRSSEPPSSGATLAFAEPRRDRGAKKKIALPRL
jgi:hypothetical protein